MSIIEDETKNGRPAILEKRIDRLVRRVAAGIILAIADDNQCGVRILRRTSYLYQSVVKCGSSRTCLQSNESIKQFVCRFPTTGVSDDLFTKHYHRNPIRGTR